MPDTETLNKLKAYLNEHNVQLVAVSKTKPVKDIKALYDAGHKIFGENKVQELADKQPQLPADIEWHMIGHLQRNKVKYIAPFVHLIHSVDSPRLLKEVNKQGRKINRRINCLLQVHIAEEETKYGFDEQELTELLESEQYKGYEHVNLQGLMGMATFTDDEDKVRREFHQLAMLFRMLKQRFFADQNDFKELSMGMSGDYKTAVEEGSTIVRIGSLIFGDREIAGD